MGSLDTENALVSLDEAKAFLGSSTAEDDLVEKLINHASWRANKEADRRLVRKNYTGTNAEYYNGDGSQILLTRNFPINSISAIYIDVSRSWGSDTLVDSDNYVIDPETQSKIVFIGTTLAVGVRVVKLEYNAGYTPVPWDLREAVLELVMYWYKEKTDKRVGVASRGIEGRTQSFTHKVPKDILNQFWNYRRITVL